MLQRVHVEGTTAYSGYAVVFYFFIFCKIYYGLLIARGRPLTDAHCPRLFLFYFSKFFDIHNLLQRPHVAFPPALVYGSLQHLPLTPTSTIVLRMTFYSLPFTPERPQATEARLEKIYEAAKYGLKGDSLALAAGLTPMQYRRLAEFDPLVEMAELKGRSDGEYQAAKALHDAAAEGDTKAALDILKHQHGWVAKQQIDVSVDQTISVIGALEKAQQRVIEGLYTDVTPQLENDTSQPVTITAKEHTHGG